MKRENTMAPPAWAGVPREVEVIWMVTTLMVDGLPMTMMMMVVVVVVRAGRVGCIKRRMREMKRRAREKTEVIMLMRMVWKARMVGGT